MYRAMKWLGILIGIYLLGCYVEIIVKNLDYPEYSRYNLVVKAVYKMEEIQNGKK